MGLTIWVVFLFFLQFITFGFACTPLYFVWEKFLGVHETKSLLKRALVRLPVVIPIWFLAIIFPFFGPINSTVGSLLVSFTVYIIPALAHMVTFASAPAREVINHINGLLQLLIYIINQNFTTFTLFNGIIAKLGLINILFFITLYSHEKCFSNELI
jgi:hypothetical protein